MNQEAQEYYNIAGWTKDKVNYNRVSKFNANRRRQVLHGQIWFLRDAKCRIPCTFMSFWKKTV